MSEENKTDNPYQPPALSDEMLAKKGGDGPKAKPDPIHWQIPWLGYGYVPLVIGLLFSSGSFGLFILSGFALLFLLPVYGLVILKLTAQRNQQGANSLGLTLFQILSMVLPILWLLFVMNFTGSPA